MRTHGQLRPGDRDERDLCNEPHEIGLKKGRFVTFYSGCFYGLCRAQAASRQFTFRYVSTFISQPIFSGASSRRAGCVGKVSAGDAGYFRIHGVKQNDAGGRGWKLSRLGGDL